ncbi:hypothetical protein N9Y17_00170 [Gammaproteobacteria bacterium]|nr:hypothetical protein [Gammaproteobacteria bacterium]
MLERLGAKYTYATKLALTQFYSLLSLILFSSLMYQFAYLAPTYTVFMAGVIVPTAIFLIYHYASSMLESKFNKEIEKISSQYTDETLQEIFQNLKDKKAIYQFIDQNHAKNSDFFAKKIKELLNNSLKLESREFATALCIFQKTPAKDLNETVTDILINKTDKKSDNKNIKTLFTNLINLFQASEQFNKLTVLSATLEQIDQKEELKDIAKPLADTLEEKLYRGPYGHFDRNNLAWEESSFVKFLLSDNQQDKKLANLIDQLKSYNDLDENNFSEHLGRYVNFKSEDFNKITTESWTCFIAELLSNPGLAVKKRGKEPSFSTIHIWLDWICDSVGDLPRLKKALEEKFSNDNWCLLDKLTIREALFAFVLIENQATTQGPTYAFFLSCWNKPTTNMKICWNASLINLTEPKKHQTRLRPPHNKLLSKPMSFEIQNHLDRKKKQDVTFTMINFLIQNISEIKDECLKYAKPSYFMYSLNQVMLNTTIHSESKNLKDAKNQSTAWWHWMGLVLLSLPEVQGQDCIDKLALDNLPQEKLEAFHAGFFRGDPKFEIPNGKFNTIDENKSDLTARLAAQVYNYGVGKSQGNNPSVIYEECNKNREIIKKTLETVYKSKIS